MRGSNFPRNTSDHCTSHPKVPRRLRDVLACLRRRLSLGVLRTSCSQIVHWRSNLFKVPSGSIRKRFVAKIVHICGETYQGRCSSAWLMMHADGFLYFWLGMRLLKQQCWQGHSSFQSNSLQGRLCCKGFKEVICSYRRSEQRAIVVGSLVMIGLGARARARRHTEGSLFKLWALHRHCLRQRTLTNSVSVPMPWSTSLDTTEATMESAPNDTPDFLHIVKQTYSAPCHSLHRQHTGMFVMSLYERMSIKSTVKSK